MHICEQVSGVQARCIYRYHRTWTLCRPSCVYVPEILLLKADTKGTAIGVSSDWLWTFTVVMITPVIINRIQWKAYLIFTIINLMFLPVVYFFYFEASNLRLEDIDLLSGKRRGEANAADGS